MNLFELRCAARLNQARDGLTVDAELVTAAESGSDRTEVLAVGADGWKGLKDDEFAVSAWGWMIGVQGHDWAGAPGLLPADLPRLNWGAVVASLIAGAVGEDVLDALFIDNPGARVRLVYHAQDDVAARLPVETLVWRTASGRDYDKTRPLVLSDDLDCSIVRVADRIPSNARPRVGARSPGAFAAALFTVRGEHRLVDDLLHGLRPLGVTENTPFGAVHEIAAIGRAADLAVFLGHGEGPGGLRLGEQRVSGEELARIMDGGVAVLAMCGSAQPRLGDARPAPALAAARTGLGLTIGFQGDNALLDQMPPFLGEVVAEVMRAAATEESGSAIPLATWEDGIRSGRRAILTHGVTPVVYVHPGLLTGRRPRRFRRSSTLQRMETRRRTCVTVPWYVPGQLACFRLNGGEAPAVRVPLTVDVGARVRVVVDRGTGAATAGSSVSTAHLEELRAHWGLSGDISVTVDRGDWRERYGSWRASHWAGFSAELSAVVRALSKLYGEPAPPAVAAMLDRAVDEDWGAHDARISLITANGGKWVRALGPRPPVAVKPVSMPQILGRSPQQHALSDPVRASLADRDDIDVAAVAAALSARDPFALLVEAQLRHIHAATKDVLPKRIAGALNGAREGYVALPGVAQVEWDPRHARGPSVAVDEFGAYDGSDELWLETTST